MKYFFIDKQYQRVKRITKKEAREMIKNNYKNADYVLENAERLFNNYIGVSFGNIAIEK